MTVISLTTDFGTADGYVGELKGVLLSHAPGARLVDVTHEVEPGDVEGGAWLLARIWERYPPGTVHLVVVDPGVGGARLPLAARAAERWFVGPDNGLLSLISRRHPVEEARRLDAERMAVPTLSDTFHGRDLFAPAAAHLARGGEAGDLGPALDSAGLVRLSLPEPERSEARIRGEILRVDRFGNLISNVPTAWLPDRPAVEIAGARLETVGRGYGDGELGELLLIRGSGGMLEIAARGGSAAVRLGAGRGEPLVVRSVGSAALPSAEPTRARRRGSSASC
ncbi:MAG: S-adenosyl-l-methionine hydroxide adenosyltransferase family protein [Gemmatimonadota bacterium]